MIHGLQRLGSEVVAAILLCMLLLPVAGAESRVGVIFPELRAPFNVIFDNIATGVDQELNKQAPRLILSNDYDPKSIKRWIEKENINAVITLGSVGMKSTMISLATFLL